MKPGKITPEHALKLAPGIELDVFVFEYVIGGLLEYKKVAGHSLPTIQVPSFSRRADSAKMVLIMIMMNCGDLTLRFGPEHYYAASKKNFIIRKTPCPAFYLFTHDAEAYGRTFEEAVCKLGIVMRRNDAF